MQLKWRRLEGKVAFITGGASGIGECTAKLFAEHGAKVVIADVQDQLGQAVCEPIGPSNSIYVHCDVTNEEHVQNAVDIAVKTYGKLDIMFCNAGITGPIKERVIDNEKGDFERVLSVNVVGVFLSMKHAARVMVPARAGTIISTASIVSTIGGAGTHAYCCSKHAIAGMTKNLAVELGQFGIRVNCVLPYAIATPLGTSFLGIEDEALENMMNQHSNLKGVTLRTDDVAKATLFLASDEAKFISGQNLFVAGTCASNCNGHGKCLKNGICECKDGFTGIACSTAVCDEQCSLHGGVCDNGVCKLRCSDYAGYTYQKNSLVLNNLSICKDVLINDDGWQHCAPPKKYAVCHRL